MRRAATAFAMSKPFTCPVCHEEVPANAKACPECGACEKSGWSEEARYDGLDLPDEAFDHDEFVSAEFGTTPPKATLPKHWWWVAVVLLGAFVWMILSAI